MMVRDEIGDVCGCARPLPTTRPHLLSEVFPQLLNGLLPPCSPDVWELSCFASVDFNTNATSALGQFSFPIAIRLHGKAIACAVARGAQHLITVSPIGVGRLSRRAGFHTHSAFLMHEKSGR